MNKLKFLLLTVLLLTSFASRVHAQDDSGQDGDTIIPPINTSDSSPPVLIEDDASDVSDVDDFEG